MSMRRRYEPMGGEVDSSQMRVSNTYPQDFSIEEIESTPSGSFVDDLTLRVRSLLMNFDDGELDSDNHPNRGSEEVGQNVFQTDALSSPSHEYCGFDNKETGKLIQDQTSKRYHDAALELAEHDDSLCSGCSQLGKAGDQDTKTSRTNTMVLAPEVENLFPYTPKIVLTETNSSPSQNLTRLAVSNQQRVGNLPSYQLFSATLKENPRRKSPTVVSMSENNVKRRPKMNSDVSGAMETHFTRTSDLQRHRFYVQPLSDEQSLEREAERSWSEIILSPESFSKNCAKSVKSLPKGNINDSYKDSQPKPVFFLPKTVTRRGREQSMSPRHLTGDDAHLSENGKSNASAIVDKEYEFLNYQSISSMSDFDSIGRDTPPLSASSIGSSKRLEWDNGADIGYSIANANSKLRRMVPNTARSEPEGISLINETLNSNATTTPINFPSSFFPSFTDTAQDISTSRQTLTNSVSCDTRDDLDRSSSPEASLSRSDSKRSVIYNSVKDVQQQSKSSSGTSRSLEKAACHSFKNQSCPDLTSLVPFQKQSKSIGVLSKSDEVMSHSKRTKVPQNSTLIDLPSEVPTSENRFSQLNQNNNTSSTDLKDLMIENSFNSATHVCNCQQSHLTGKERKYYPGSDSEKSYKSRDEYEESFELTTDGNQVYDITHISHDADVVWINENAVFNPSLHYIAEMSELPGNCPIGSLNSGSFLLLSNNPGKINENQFSRNVGNLWSGDNSNEYSGSVENKPHIRWYPFSSVNAQDIKNVSTQTAMSFIAKQGNETGVQVASEQQTSSPEVTRSTSEESSDDSAKNHQDVSSRNPPSQFNPLQASRKSDETSSCHEFHSSSETVLVSQNILRGHSMHSVPHISSNTLPVSQKIPKGYIEKPNIRKHPVNNDYLTSHQSSGNSKAAYRNGSKGVLPRTVSDTEDPLVHQDSKQQSNLGHDATSLECLKDSKRNQRSFCWLAEEKEVECEERSDISSSPDLYGSERKLGVGQCETVSRSGTGEETTLERPLLSDNYRKTQYSSSDSDAINYPPFGGISNSDDIPDSDSHTSTRSSVEGYSSGEPRKQYLPSAPIVNPSLPTQRYYFSKLSPPANIYSDGEPGNVNKEISIRSGNAMGDSNHEVLQSVVVTGDTNLEVSDPKPIFSGDGHSDASDRIKLISKSIIDNANRAISDSKVISSAAKRLNATDLYSQSQPISPFKVSANLEKSNSDPVISLPRNSFDRHKSSVPSTMTPFDFKPERHSKKMSRGKSGRADRFKSSIHQVNDNFSQLDSYDKSRDDLELKGKLAEGHESPPNIINKQIDPFNVSQSDGNSPEGVLFQKPTIDVLPPAFKRDQRSYASSSHSQGFEIEEKISREDKPRIRDSSTNPPVSLHPSIPGNGSRLESLGGACSQRKYNRNEGGHVQSDPFQPKVVDDCSQNDKGHSFPADNQPSHTTSETDNVRKSLRTFERHYVSIGVQVSEPVAVSKLCNFCKREENSLRHSCYEKEIFKDRLNHVLEENLDPLKRHCKRSGATFCVFQSGCVCCCSKTLQEAFNVHRSELAERIEARKNGVLEQARMKHVINFPKVGSYNKKVIDSRKDVPRISSKEKSANKENNNKLKRNRVSSLTVNKQKERQRNLLTFNKIMSKIYSQRLKTEILKGKVNFHRHENLITF